MDVRVRFPAGVPLSEIDDMNPIDVSTACAFDGDFGANGVAWEQVKAARDARLARDGKRYEPPYIRPSTTVGGVDITRNVLLQTLVDLLKQEGPIHDIDKAAVRYIIDKAREENIVEVARPAGWDKVVIDVTPLDEVKEGDLWIKVSLGDKQGGKQKEDEVS